MAGKDKEVVAKVGVDVEPKLDTKKLKEQLGEIVKQGNLNNKKITIGSKLDLTGLKDSLEKVPSQVNLNNKKVTVKTKLDLTGLKDDLNKIPSQSNLNNKKVTVSANLDTKKLKDSLNNLSAGNKKLNVGISIDKSSFKDAIANLPKKSITLGVKLDTAMFKSELARLSGKNIKLSQNLSYGSNGRSNSSQAVKQAKEEIKSLRAERAKAIQEMERAYNKYGKDSKQFRGAKRKYSDANEEYLRFGTASGLVSQKQAANELSKIIGSYNKGNPIRLHVEKQWREAIERANQLQKELDSINPVKKRERNIANAYASDAHETQLLEFQKAASVKSEKEAQDELLASIKSRYRTEVAYLKELLKSDKEREAVLQKEQQIRLALGKKGLSGGIAPAEQPSTPKLNNNSRYKLYNAEAQRYASEAEKVWREAGNKASPEFERLRNQFTETMRKMIEFKRSLGNMSAGQASNIYSRMASSLGRMHPLYQQLIDDAKRLNNEQKSINTDVKGGVPSNRSNLSSAGNFFNYITRFVGRSSKGVGSTGEATADALGRLQSLGGAIGKVSVVAAGVVAGFAAISATTVGVVKSVQFFGSILIDIGQKIYSVLQPGIELYKQQQSAIFSFDAALRSNALLNGKSLSNSPDISRGIATSLITKATIDAEMSAFSLEEILRSLQGTLPILLSKGMNLSQAYEVNKGVAGVAKMIQLTPSQILQETRDLAQGSITSRGSQVAGALGISNKDLEQFQGDQDKIFDYLMKRFSEYSSMLSEFEDTALGRWQQLAERWGVATEKIVEAVAPQFKGLFEYLISLTGQYVDENGRYLDALTGKWMNEDGSEFSGSFDQLENPHFELSETLEKAKDILVDILDMTAQMIDNIISYAMEVTNTEEPLDALKSIVATILQLFEFSVKAFLWLIDLFKDGNTLVTFFLNVWVVIKATIDAASLVFQFIVTLVGNLVSLAAQLYYWLKGDKAAADNEAAYQKKRGDEFKAARDAFVNNNDKWYSTPEEYITDFGSKNNRKYTGLEDAFNKYKGTDITKTKPGDNTNWKDVVGRKSDKEDEKARKKAIKESQKILKDHIASLKEVLSDTLDKLKELLEKNDVAYKEGFTGISEYLSTKADLEVKEAQAKLTEAKEELRAIQSTKYDSPYDKSKAEHDAQRKIDKQTKELNKLLDAQNEIGRDIANFTNMVATSQTNMLAIMQNGFMFNGGNAGAAGQGSGGKPAQTPSDRRFSGGSARMSEEEIWKWWRSNGYSAEVTAGIMGRLKQERPDYSPTYAPFQYVPDVGEVGGFGMFQLTYDNGKGYKYPNYQEGRKIYRDSRLARYLDWCDKNGLQYESNINQLVFAHEVDMKDQQYYAKLQGLGSWYPQDMNNLSLEQAALKFTDGFERGQRGEEIPNAREIYNKYKDLPVDNLIDKLDENTKALMGTTTSVKGVFDENAKYNGGPLKILSPYNASRNNASGHHNGVDISADPWTPIYAPIGGKVSRAERNGDPNGYGTVINLDVDAGEIKQLRFGHLIELAVEQGAEVVAGQLLGYTGFSGNADASAPHLHFEALKVRDSYKAIGNTVDPTNIALKGFPDSIPLAGPHSGNRSMEASKALQEAYDKLNDEMSAVNDKIFGNRPMLNVKLRDTYRKLEKARRGEDALSKRMAEILDIRAKLEENSVIAEALGKQLNFNTKRIATTGAYTGTDIAYGRKAYGDTSGSEQVSKYFDFFFKPTDFNKLRFDISKTKQLQGNFENPEKLYTYYKKVNDKLWETINNDVNKPIWEEYKSKLSFVEKLKSDINSTKGVGDRSLAELESEVSDAEKSVLDYANKSSNEAIISVMQSKFANIDKLNLDLKHEMYSGGSNVKAIEEAIRVAEKDAFDFINDKTNSAIINELNRRTARLDKLKSFIDVFKSYGVQSYSELENLLNDANTKLANFLNDNNNKLVVSSIQALEGEITKIKGLVGDNNFTTESAKVVAEAYKKWKKANDDLWDMQNVEGKKGTAAQIEQQTAEVKALLADYNSKKTGFDSAKNALRNQLAQLETELALSRQKPANQIAELREEFIKATNLGNTDLADEIRNKLVDAYNSLKNTVNSWVSTINDRFDAMKSYFDVLPKTTLQAERGEKELTAYRNRALVPVYRQALAEYVDKRNSKLGEIASNEAELKSLTESGTGFDPDRVKWLTANISLAKEEVRLFNQEIIKTQQNLRLAEYLSTIIPLLDEIKITAKQALQDGLIKLLTDGVNEAKSLGEALRNMAVDFLKIMQEFFAKQMVTSLMNQWFRVPNPATGTQVSVVNLAPGAWETTVVTPLVTAMDSLRATLATNTVSTQADTVTEAQNNVVTAQNNIETAQNNIETAKNTVSMQTSTITNAVSSTAGAVAGVAGAGSSAVAGFKGLGGGGFLNAPFFQEILGVVTDITGSALGQLAGDFLAIKSIFKGDTKEKLLGTIFLELQLLYMGQQQLIIWAQMATNWLQVAVNWLQVAANWLQEIAFGIQNLGMGGNYGTEGNYATGGYISGPGTSTSDSIPAMLSNGEYVIKADAVKRMGVNYLNAINNGNFTKVRTGVHHYAQGGLVSDLAQEQTARGISNFGKDISNNISNTANISVALVRDEQEGMKQLLRSPEGQRIMLDFSRKYASVTSRF